LSLKSQFLLQVGSLHLVDASALTTAETEHDADFWRNKGNAFFKFGDMHKAKDCYSKSLAAGPSASAFANRALVSTKLKEWDGAEADCTEVCGTHPQPPLIACRINVLKRV
jgi:sperm-associated antigen 1